jgi:hypothetical protein
MALFNRRRLKHWWLLGVVAMVAAVGYRCLPLAPLPPHSGDGMFADLSWQGKAFGIFSVFDVRGFAISMPQFDLGKDHNASYRVNNLPDIGQECRLYLAIHDPQGRWLMRDKEIRKLRGSLTLEVIDRDRGLISHAEGPLSDYVWGYWRAANRLYQMDAPSFASHSGEEDTLRVAYQADPGLAGYRGYCYLECGGHK